MTNSPATAAHAPDCHMVTMPNHACTCSAERGPVRISIVARTHRDALDVAETFGLSVSRWRFVTTAMQLRGLPRHTPILLAPGWRYLQPAFERDAIEETLKLVGFSDVWSRSAIR